MEELIVRIENLLRVKQTDSSSAILTDVIKLGKYDFVINRLVLTTGNEEKKLSYRVSELLNTYGKIEIIKWTGEIY